MRARHRAAAVASKASRRSTSRRIEGIPTVNEQPPSRRRRPDGRRAAAVASKASRRSTPRGTSYLLGSSFCWGWTSSMPKARSDGGITWATGIAMVTGFGVQGAARACATGCPTFWNLGSEAPRALAPLARRPRGVPRGVSATYSREFSADYLSLKSVRGPSTSFHPKSAESRLPGAREPSSGKVQLRVAVVSAAVLHLASGGLACVHRTPRAAAGTSCPDPRTRSKRPNV